MEIAVRPAASADRDVIADFNVRLAFETERKVLDSHTVSAGVAAVLDDPAKGRYYLACLGDWIVGQAMITWEWSDWRNGVFWWLQSVYVDEEFRRQGVFRRLCEHVVEEARRSPGVVGVRLYVEEENHAAQRAYRKLGFGSPGYLVLECGVSKDETQTLATS